MMTGTGGSEEPAPDRSDWFGQNTVAERVDLPLAQFGVQLQAQALVDQLDGYDPGSLLRCEVAMDPAYETATDALGGVTWGYNVRRLEDLSKPRFQAGLQRYRWDLYPPALVDAAGGGEVEIVKPDIVGVTDEVALFHSRTHGLLLVDLTGDAPRFGCAAPLPGNVDQFFFHQGHLVAMTQAVRTGTRDTTLLHFQVSGTALDFVESVSLGEVSILDSRRFNDKLVFYTDLSLQPATTQAQNPGGGPIYIPPAYGGQHRSLRVYTLGDQLTEELHDTLIDTTVDDDQLLDTMTWDPSTPVGTEISQGRRFGRAMWASDHYFAVTQEIHRTFFAGMRTRTYSVCTESHTVEVSYQYCQTQYETRPNPDYTPPDNSSGDRSCKGVTLSDCLRQVARVASETIEVPVGRTCEERVRTRFICDAREQRTVEYPTFTHDAETKIFIYEYQPSGFVRLASEVREIDTAGLSNMEFADVVPALSTSSETFDLTVPGSIQELRFQNGILYVISEGVLQVYTLSGSSLVRTATLPVVNDTLQSTLFSNDRIYLSDFSWQNRTDTSTLRVVNLQNPAFPTIEAATHSLPGGHRNILASEHGILTIGAVNRFEGQTINAIKLGLFSDPFVAEEAYLVLATHYEDTYLGDDEGFFFSGPDQRLVLPYRGYDRDVQSTDYRVSLSHVEPGAVVSEGAVDVPEPVSRIRPVTSAQGSFLTFAESSIEWLTPAGDAWDSTPVLEYFVPIAVLRLNEQDDYAEVQRLGEQCRIFLSNARTINQREQGKLSEPFECRFRYFQAYDRTILFNTQGYAFDEDAKITVLTADEVAQVQEKIDARETCLLTLDLLDDVSMDYDESYDKADFTCVSPEELNRLTEEANAAENEQP